MPRLIFKTLSHRRAQHHIDLARFGPRTVTFKHTHDFPEITLVTSGAGLHDCNGSAEPLCPGSLSLVLARDTHFYRTADEHLSFYNLALEPEWWREFADLVGEKQPRALNRQLTPDEQAQATAMLGQLLAVARPSPLMLLHTVTALWRWLAESPFAAGRESLGPSESRPPEWLAQLAADWNDPELLREPFSYWQKRSGRSAEHFSRSCRRYFGAPPSELLNRARIECVKAQLRATNGKIVTLAFDAGFQHLGFFYRTFRRLEACTPREWVARELAKASSPFVPA